MLKWKHFGLPVFINEFIQEASDTSILYTDVDDLGYWKCTGLDKRSYCAQLG